jgi:hypothetical protein
VGARRQSSRSPPQATRFSASRKAASHIRIYDERNQVHDNHTRLATSRADHPQALPALNGSISDEHSGPPSASAMTAWPHSAASRRARGDHRGSMHESCCRVRPETPRRTASFRETASPSRQVGRTLGSQGSAGGCSSARIARLPTEREAPVLIRRYIARREPSRSRRAGPDHPLAGSCAGVQCLAAMRPWLDPDATGACALVLSNSKIIKA